ncbi:hypothetical protein [Amycolatopsis sp. H20-H5]|uniref:hypothetical protein n=1 Tax=Amycolatopsis sp. H20-H5 TaxID=3046309 RepID=UPI002DBDA8D3|nr:hypothetical protein [Amycolatopsis sp. H20-H5]MEC3975237.1 hypothetical protein [Amycolatopsis sp. H20-H5]
MVAATAAIGLVSPSVAFAAPPTSSAVVSPASVARGDTFTVTEQIYNSQSFTVTGGKAALYGQQSAITDVVDVVSCTGTIAPCGVLGSSLRGAVGDVGAGESRTVVFTLKVKDTAPAGAVTLQSQFVGDNYSFETLDGPVLTVTGASLNADVGVSLNASASGLLSSTVDYTIRVTNSGPATATGIHLVATYAAGLQFSHSADCTRVGSTRTVSCDVASLASGGSKTLRFSAGAVLLTVGSLSTTVVRQASSPTDPNASNDSATKTCSALTGLLVSC